MTRLSVIIPACNRAHLIAETLRSLLAQTLPADEIIVVDDGSTDDTAAVAESFGHPVKVIRQQNGGPAAARNTGFRVSQGEFIHFFDSDDLAAPNKHEQQMQALEQTGADIAICPWIKGTFAGNRFEADNLVLQQNGLPDGHDLIKPLLTHWSIVPHSMLFRRSAIEKSGAFDESYFVAEDQMMFLRCLLQGARVVHTGETILLYRLNDAGKITENNAWAARKLRDWTRFLLQAREICVAQGIDPMNWFGYRSRLWQAARAMQAVNMNDPELAGRLDELGFSAHARGMYPLHHSLQRWQGALQQRLTGGRAHSFFKIGNISEAQIKLIILLGYAHDQPVPLPWLPQGKARCAASV